jgi:hypothetical protein
MHAGMQPWTVDLSIEMRCRQMLRAVIAQVRRKAQRQASGPGGVARRRAFVRGTAISPTKNIETVLKHRQLTAGRVIACSDERPLPFKQRARSGRRASVARDCDGEARAALRIEAQAPALLRVLAPTRHHGLRASIEQGRPNPAADAERAQCAQHRCIVDQSTGAGMNWLMGERDLTV